MKNEEFASALPICALLLCIVFVVAAAARLKGTPSQSVATEKDSSLFTLHSSLNDSVYWLNEWKLPYPVYRFCTGDVDGDGQEDALVGVIKKTRFHRDLGRRIFIFKLVDERSASGRLVPDGRKKVRPLWLGSRLGATLIDFRFVDGCVRTLETDGMGRYGVVDYRWNDFGMTFERFIVKDTDEKHAMDCFSTTN